MKHLDVLLLAALVAGCAPAAPADDAPPPAETAAPEPTASPVPSGTPTPPATRLFDLELTPLIPATLVWTPPPGSVPPEILDPILDDAAARSGVARDTLVIVRAEAVTWSDGSLGCPEPDQAYIQILIDGYWVVISAGQAVYDYRVDGSGYFKLCQGGIAPGGPVIIHPGEVLPVETVEPEHR
jgi:hypothetical protein